MSVGHGKTAPRAQCESLESLNLAETSIELQKMGRNNSNTTLESLPTSGDLAQVKFAKDTTRSSSVDIGGATECYSGMGKEELMKFASDPFWIRLRWLLFVLFWLAWLGMLAGAIGIVIRAPKCPAPPPLDYWQKGTVYSVNVRSFQDGGEIQDGIGDLRGVALRLDYLVQLGVNMISLSPVYSEHQPEQGDGYFITNFTDIEPTCGTLSDFEKLVQAAKAKNVKIIMDLVPSHSSNMHQWFTASAANRSTEFADYYIWRSGQGSDPPTAATNVFGESAWTYEPKRSQYYYHKYSPSQPHLNLRNPKVRQAMMNVVRFWLDLGASGFRLPAAPHLIEEDTQSSETTASLIRTLDLLEDFRTVLREYENKDGEHRVFIVESDNDVKRTVHLYGEEFAPLADMSIKVDLIRSLKRGFSGEQLRHVISSYTSAVPTWAWPSWTLGSEGSRRVSSRFDSYLTGGLAMVQLLLPGTPIVYYGEEIGMSDIGGSSSYGSSDLETDLRSNRSRAPMRWSTSKNAGFSNCSCDWLPTSGDVENVNVETQLADANSHLHIYRSLVALRKQAAVMTGEFHSPDLSNSDIYAFTRIRKGSPGYLVLLNLGNSHHLVNCATFPNVGSEAEVVIRSYGKHGKTNAKKVKTTEVHIESHEAIVLTFLPDFTTR